MKRIIQAVVVLIMIGLLWYCVGPSSEQSQTPSSATSDAEEAKPAPHPYWNLTIVRNAATPEIADAQRTRLFAEIGKFEHSPCNTNLFFSKPLYRWHIGCPGCASLLADVLYPQAVIDLVQDWAVNQQLTVARLLQITGECP